MKLKRVKPSQIKIPELRVTAKFDEETRELLRSSIKEAGILAPVLVQEIEEELVLVDGLHRLEDAIATGDQPMDVAILDGDMVDLLCRNLFLDHVRGKTPVSDMVKVIGALYTEYAVDSEKIREKTGLSREYIEKLIKISQASPTVQQSLDDGVIGVGHAFELSRLPYAVQQEEVIAKHQVYKFAVKELKELVDQTLAAMQEIAEAPPPPPGTRERPAPVYHCEGCKDQVEPRYLRPVMLCPNCFGEVWRLAKLRPTSEAEIIEETPSP